MANRFLAHEEASLYVLPTLWFRSTSILLRGIFIQLPNEFTDGLSENGKKAWLLFDAADSTEIKQSGYQPGRQYAVPDFQIIKLKLSFVDPVTRDKVCAKKILRK